MHASKICLLLFFAASKLAHSECKSAIDPRADSLQFIQNNTICLANEVESLKNENAQIKTQNSQLQSGLADAQAALNALKARGPAMGIQLPNPSFHSAPECHDWASQYLNVNHFTNLQDNPPTGVGGTNSSSKVAFLCLPSSQILFVVGSADPAAVQQWSQVFMDAIKATFHLP